MAKCDHTPEVSCSLCDGWAEARENATRAEKAEARVAELEAELKKLREPTVLAGSDARLERMAIVSYLNNRGLIWTAEQIDLGVHLQDNLSS
jgi:hypothetical protein